MQYIVVPLSNSHHLSPCFSTTATSSSFSVLSLLFSPIFLKRLLCVFPALLSQHRAILKRKR